MDQAKAQVTEFRNALQKCTDDADALVILSQLAEIKMDVDILTSTAIGVLVNKYRKSESTELSNLSKALVSAWKRVALEAQTPLKVRNGSGNHVKANGKSSKPAKKVSDDALEEASTVEDGESEASAIDAAVSAPKIDAVPEPKPGDIRSILREKLNVILEAGDDSAKIKMACQIEEHMFVKHGRDSGQSYREHFRSILFNLRDSKNPELKRELLESSLTPSDLVRRTPEELGSAEQRKRVREAFEKAVARARTDWEDTQEEQEATWCDMFQCPMCNERKTKFKQKQIRSADEPMTTFIVCGGCKYRWTDN
jgi:transcription elongation factor S-II